MLNVWLRKRFNISGQQCNLRVEIFSFRITLVEYTVLNYKQKRKQQNASWPKESDDTANIHTFKVRSLYKDLGSICSMVVKIKTGNQNQTPGN